MSLEQYSHNKKLIGFVQALAQAGAEVTLDYALLTHSVNQLIMSPLFRGGNPYPQVASPTEI